MLRYRINTPVTATQVTWGLDGMTLGSRGLMSPLYMAVTANQLNKMYANKVDTTYRCEALKEVMSFKYVKY